MSEPAKGVRAAQTTVSFYAGDMQLLEYIQEFLGTSSRNEAVRASVRAYAYHLQQIGPRKAGRRANTSGQTERESGAGTDSHENLQDVPG